MVGRLKKQVRVALDRLEAEALASHEERQRAGQALSDVDKLKADLAHMHQALQKEQLQQEEERKANASDRAQSLDLRHQLQAQMQHMEERMLALQKTIDEYEDQESARADAVSELVEQRDKMLHAADDSIASMQAHLLQLQADKSAKDADADALLQHLAQLKLTLQKENARVRDTQALVVQLEVGAVGCSNRCCRCCSCVLALVLSINVYSMNV